MKRCEKHNRYNCSEFDCKNDNAGNVSVTATGDLAVGIGSGLAIDVATGDIGIQIAPGVVFDL